MNTGSSDNIEQERIALPEDEAKTPQIVTPAELPEANFGVDLEEYLHHLEEEFGPSADRVSAEKLIKIKHDLRQIEANQATPANASESLLLVFQNMQAWENQMKALADVDPNQQQDAKNHFYSSQKTFMTSCHSLYPQLTYSTSLSLAGSEVFRMERELAGVNISDLQARIKEIQDLEALAVEIGDKVQSDPEKAIQDLKAISLKISQGVDNSLRQGDLGEEEQKQLSTCVEILYKVQILIDKIKVSDAYKTHQVNQENISGQTETGLTQESKETPANLEARWNPLLATDLGSMEDFLTNDSRKKFDVLDFDAQKSEMLDAQLENIWLDFHKDERSSQGKMTEYKQRLAGIIDRTL